MFQRRIKTSEEHVNKHFQLVGLIGYIREQTFYNTKEVKGFNFQFSFIKFNLERKRNKILHKKGNRY